MRLELDRSAWKRVALGDVVRNVNNTVRDAASAGIDRIIAMEHMEPGELKIARWGPLTDGSTFTRRVLPGQTLFGKRRAYQRKVAYAEFDAICSGDILTFEPDEFRMLPEFLPFLVQSNAFFEHALETSAGSLSPRTNWRDLSNFKFDLPPLDEQKRIADLMWAIESHRAALSDAPTMLGNAYDSWITERIRSYPAIRLEEVVKLQHGRAVPSDLYGKGIFPLLRPGDMKSDGSVSWSNTSVCIPEDFANQYEIWILEPGDLVINMTAQTLEDRFLGRICRISERALLNQRIGRLVANDGVCRDFLFVALRSADFSDWVARKCEGSKVKHIHWRHIADYPIPIPPLSVQELIVHEASCWSAASRASLDENNKLLDLRTSLFSEIFGDS